MKAYDDALIVFKRDNRPSSHIKFKQTIEFDVMILYLGLDVDSINFKRFLPLIEPIENSFHALVLIFLVKVKTKNAVSFNINVSFQYNNAVIEVH